MKRGRDLHVYCRQENWENEEKVGFPRVAKYSLAVNIIGGRGGGGGGERDF